MVRLGSGKGCREECKVSCSLDEEPHNKQKRVVLHSRCSRLTSRFPNLATNGVLPWSQEGATHVLTSAARL